MVYQAVKTLRMSHEISSIGELEQTIAGETGILVYFYNNRCAPCISLRPKVQAMVDEDFPKLKLMFVNAEQNPAIAAHFGIFANPCILVFFDGREFQRYSKYISINQLGNDLERIYNIAFRED